MSSRNAKYYGGIRDSQSLVEGPKPELEANSSHKKTVSLVLKIGLIYSSNNTSPITGSM